jgi:hypothetical protein
MKATFLTVLLTLSCSSALAEWVAVSTSDASTFYVDRSDYEVSGHLRKFWSNENAFKPDKNGTLSTQAYYEINCLHDSTNLLYVAYFDEPFGKGKTISAHLFKEKDNWTPNRPGSALAAMQNFVCNQ